MERDTAVLARRRRKAFNVGYSYMGEEVGDMQERPL